MIVEDVRLKIDYSNSLNKVIVEYMKSTGISVTNRVNVQEIRPHRLQKQIV